MNTLNIKKISNWITSFFIDELSSMKAGNVVADLTIRRYGSVVAEVIIRSGFPERNIKVFTC